MKNLRKFIVMFLSVALFAAAACSNPFKVIDPSDPKFNPDNFSFSDYKGREELILVYKKLFPVGVSKAFVDRVLVKAGNSYPNQDPMQPRRWSYVHPRSLGDWDGPSSDIIIFDSNGNFQNIYLGTLEPPLYPSPTLKELDAEIKKETQGKHDR